MACSVTVYITAHNYAAYLEQSIQSVLTQTFSDWELIIIDDGSTDHTPDILNLHCNNNKIRILSHPVNQGLTKSANVAIREATGRYVMRLDADDYLDPHALLVMVTTLDANPGVGLVYPDYYHVDENGVVMEMIRRKQLHTEAKVLDLPAHGACTMFRKSCIDALGGYNESIRCQDGYDFWIRLIDQYPVLNVNLPLFYYRKHSVSLTTNQAVILNTRRYIKNLFIEKKYVNTPYHVLAIIPARSHPDYPRRLFDGAPLIDRTLESVLASSMISKSVVVSEDQNLRAYCRNYGVETMGRPAELADANTPLDPTIQLVVAFQRSIGFQPDVVLVLPPNAPFRRTDHIEEAITTLRIFNTDSVVSVTEAKGNFYQHREYGMSPLFQNRLLRCEQEALYRENGAVFASKSTCITPTSFLGTTVGHIVMPLSESWQIDSEYEFNLCEQMAKSARLSPDDCQAVCPAV